MKKLFLMVGLIIFLTPSVYADYEMFECKVRNSPFPEIFKINYGSGLMHYVETAMGDKINYFEEYKRKGNVYKISPLLKAVIPLLMNDPDGLNVYIEQMYEMRSGLKEKIKDSKIEKEKKKDLLSQLKILNLELKYIVTAKYNFEIDSKTKILKIYTDDPPELIREKWYQEPDISECLSKVISPEMKWVGYAISAYDYGTTKGLEREGKMIFPRSESYDTEGECEAEFLYILDNDPVLKEKYPQTTDIPKSYMFGCVQK